MPCIFLKSHVLFVLATALHTCALLQPVSKSFKCVPNNFRLFIYIFLILPGNIQNKFSRFPCLVYSSSLTASNIL